MTDPFSTTLGKGVGIVLVQKDEAIAALTAENKALRAVCHNLATTLQLEGLHGMKSLRQQFDAHQIKWEG